MDKLRKNMNVPAGAMLFAALLLIGVWIGCLFTWFSPSPLSFEQSSVFFNGLFDDLSAGWLRVFSAFLFDFLFYLLLIFLFGMTFLGAAVIPAAVFCRGFTLGASLSALLASEGTGVYFQSWITYLPVAVCCTLVFLILSGRAFAASLKVAGQLLSRATLPVAALKRYSVQFLAALLIFVCAAAVRCGLVFLASIFS